MIRFRFLAPDDAAYERVATAFFGCLFDVRVDGGGEIRVTDDVSAASLWNPPRASAWTRSTQL